MQSEDPVEALTRLLEETGRVAVIDARRMGEPPTYDARYRATVTGLVLSVCGKHADGIRKISEPLLRLYQFVAVHPPLLAPLLAWVKARDKGKLLPVSEEAGFPAGYAADRTHNRILDYLTATGALYRHGTQICLADQPRTFLHQLVDAALESERFAAERRVLKMLAPVFPTAVRNRIELDGDRDVEVYVADARVVLEREDGARLEVRRNICGGDTKVLHVDTGDQQATLKVGTGSMQSGVQGFQSFLRNWIGLKTHFLLNAQGNEYPIYLENLAALAVIGQLRGWTGLHVQQIHRYGLREIEEASFEQLLGLDARLVARLEHQKAVAREQLLKHEATQLAAEYDAIAAAERWTDTISARGSVSQIVKRWTGLNVLARARETFGFDFTQSRERIEEKMDALRKSLSEPGELSAGAAPTQAMNEVLTLKERRSTIQTEVRRARSQLREQDSLLASVEQRLATVTDLLAFKEKGIGILPSVSCPTCHQSVDPGTFQLGERGGEELRAYAETLKKQQLMLQTNLDLLRRTTAAKLAEAERIEDEYRAAERALSMINAAVGADRETVVMVATDLMKLERELNRQTRLHRDLELFQGRLDDFLQEARELTSSMDLAEDESLLARYVSQLRQHVLNLRVADIKPSEIKRIHLSEKYVPMLGERDLLSYGSASDRARLVLAYVIALLDVGLGHPGFVILDEPVQQNPDQDHRHRLVDFFVQQSQRGRQVLLFISLRDHEVKQLRDAGVTVQTPDGEHFLKFVSTGVS